ncbi:MAG: glycoside hydrolase family 3 C-terminal domain-containing protein, partial [Acidimicrobiales bacterium]
RILGIAARTGALAPAPAAREGAAAAPAAREGAAAAPAAREGAAAAPAARERSVDDPAHRRLARRAAVASMVLLKNEAGSDDRPVLPLDPGRLRRLAVIGPNADVARILGGGSARVTPHYQVSPLDGLRAAAPEALEVDFERGCVIDRSTPALDPRLIGPARLQFFANTEFAGAPVAEVEADSLEFTWFGAIHPDLASDSFSARARARLSPTVSGAHVLSLTSAGKSRLWVDGAVVVDNWESQAQGTSFFGLGSAEVKARIDLVAGQDYEVVVEFATRKNWPMAGFIAGGQEPEPDDLMEEAVALGERADAAIVVVGLNAGWETEGRDRTTMDLAGRQDELVRRVAAVNPNTVVVVNAGAPVAMDWAADVGAIVCIWYPGQELGHALAEVIFGCQGPGGRLPTTFPRRLQDTPAFTNYPGESGQVLYGEGIFVGYRWYDKRDIEPLFPFGHGLDYTNFSYGPLDVPDVVEPEADLRVQIEVTNTGSRRGTEVIQAYVSDVESSLVRPVKELKAFAKVTLAPGETRRVDLVIGASALSFWDPGRHAWVAEAGEFEVAVGRSATDIRGRGRFSLSEPSQRLTQLG